MQPSGIISNADLEPFRIDPADTLFTIGTPNVAVIGLTAGNTNTLGHYDGPGVGNNTCLTRLSLTGFGLQGDGSVGNPFPGTVFDPDPLSATIGFVLESVSGGGGDGDYDDAIFVIDAQRADVPVPATLGLLGVGLVGLGLLGRRRRSAA